MGYTIVDCAGKFLCPGLFDFHAHMIAVPIEAGIHGSLRMPRNAMLMRIGVHGRSILERGFTTVRDCGGMEHYVAEAIDENIMLGPRTFFCGRAIGQTGGHGDTRPVVSQAKLMRLVSVIFPQSVLLQTVSKNA